ncbi:hypothetical protein HK096_004307 [Nowakowskiella sp. JEL0078]|nr:hypothetical protein HK096_004307 [Nowakowskiella sp. JEL0078]
MHINRLAIVSVLLISFTILLFTFPAIYRPLLFSRDALINNMKLEQKLYQQNELTLLSQLEDLKKANGLQIISLNSELQRLNQTLLVQDTESERSHVFKQIFKNNLWGNAESRSGAGSTLEITVNSRRFISTMWQIFGTTSFLDSPCGDCNWQPSIPGFERIKYTGVDIVSSEILQNAQKYISKPNMRFINLDLVAHGSMIPKDQFEMVMCRDAIQHLPLEDGLQIYKSLEATGAKILITNVHLPINHPDVVSHNFNIRPGDFYANNPLYPPFNFGLPIFYTLDTFHSVDRHVKLMAAFELPIVGKGNGTFDFSIFNITNGDGSIVPVGKRGEELWEKFQKLNFTLN